MVKRALIVDSDTDASELIRSFVMSTGMDVLVLAASGDATQYLNNENFAMLFFGVRMPSPDGIALAQTARDSGTNQMTPVILVGDDPAIEEICQRFGSACFFLRKPVDRSQLVKLLQASQGTTETAKRLFRRVPLRSKVRLIFEQQEWEGETVDVSLGGMLVKGPSRIPAGTSVSVTLFLPGQTNPVIGAGRITRVQGQDLMGIYLNRMNMSETGRLQEFLLPMIS